MFYLFLFSIIIPLWVKQIGRYWPSKVIFPKNYLLDYIGDPQWSSVQRGRKGIRRSAVQILATADIFLILFSFSLVYLHLRQEERMLREPLACLSCAQWKRDFFVHFQIISIVFDNAKACASMCLLVSIHNKQISRNWSGISLPKWQHWQIALG